MKSWCQQLNCSVSRAIMLVMFLSTAGCAHFIGVDPYGARNRTPDYSYAERVRQEQNAKMAEIRRENPTWDSYISDDVLVIECSADGRKCEGK